MANSRLKRLIGWGLISTAQACSADPQSGGLVANAPAGATSAMGPTELTFEPPSTLTLQPMQRASLLLRVAPPGTYVVRFAIGAESKGTATDASLDRDEVVTNDDGTASVEVTAPTKAATFRVRASVGTLSVERGLSVSGSGFARLLVSPEYLGKRKISEWIVSASANMECAALTGSAIVDGDIMARASTSTQPLLLEGVPAGTKLTVLVRADGVAAGCLKLGPLLPGKTERASISAADRPLSFEAPGLLTEFGIGAPSQAFYDTLASDITKAVTALAPAGSGDVKELLDSMQSLSGTRGPLFAAARTQGKWDERVAQVWGSSAQMHLRMLANQWMSAGVKALEDTAAITGTLAAASDGSKQALFDLLTVGQVDGARAGFSPNATATWSGQPGDTLQVGLNLFWHPSELVTALAERQAKSATSTSVFVDALRTTLKCDALATALSPSGVAYETCGATCLSSLCQDAGAVLWDRARKASGAEARTLQVNASAQATVNSMAQVVELKGNWLGMLGDAPLAASVTGTLNGYRMP